MTQFSVIQGDRVARC